MYLNICFLLNCVWICSFYQDVLGYATQDVLEYTEFYKMCMFEYTNINRLGIRICSNLQDVLGHIKIKHPWS